MSTSVKVKRLHPDAVMPTAMTNGSAGFDLSSTVDININAGNTEVIPTGIALEIPEGFEGQVRSRSSFARIGVMVANGVGTIDSDYRGEIGVILHNAGKWDKIIRVGDRIAQLVISPVQTVDFEEVSELTTTQRGAGGYGSTGV